MPKKITEKSRSRQPGRPAWGVSSKSSKAERMAKQPARAQQGTHVLNGRSRRSQLDKSWLQIAGHLQKL